MRDRGWGSRPPRARCGGASGKRRQAHDLRTCACADGLDLLLKCPPATTTRSPDARVGRTRLGVSGFATCRTDAVRGRDRRRADARAAAGLTRPRAGRKLGEPVAKVGGVDDFHRTVGSHPVRPAATFGAGGLGFGATIEALLDDARTSVRSPWLARGHVMAEGWVPAALLELGVAGHGARPSIEGVCASNAQPARARGFGDARRRRILARGGVAISSGRAPSGFARDALGRRRVGEARGAGQGEEQQAESQGHGPAMAGRSATRQTRRRKSWRAERSASDSWPG